MNTLNNKLPKEVHLIISSIRSLLGEELDIRFPSALDWGYFKRLLAYHELGPFIYLAFRGYESFIPSSIYELFNNAYYHWAVRCQLLRVEFYKILSALKNADVEVIPLKGMGLLEDVYREYPVRPMVDTDILVRERDISKVKRVLLDLGYTQELFGIREEYWRRKQIHLTFYKKWRSHDFILEVHWGLDFKRKGKVILSEVWERLRQIDTGFGSIRLLSPEDMFLSLALHKRRFGKLLCLKNALDGALLLRKYRDKFDWDYLLEMCEKYKLNSLLFFFLTQIALLSTEIFQLYILRKFHIPFYKRKLIRGFIDKKTFSKEIMYEDKKIYLMGHFLLYDSNSEPLKYILHIPQEQFAKFYDLPCYTPSTEWKYGFRLLYIPLRLPSFLLRKRFESFSS